MLIELLIVAPKTNSNVKTAIIVGLVAYVFNRTITLPDPWTVVVNVLLLVIFIVELVRVLHVSLP